MQGSNVVVIGGSSGIGLATAQAALSAGAAVTIVSRNLDKLRQAASKCVGANIAVADINARSQIEAVFASMDRVDHLVITAGSFYGGMIRDTDPDVMIDALRDRLADAIYAVSAVLPRMSASGSITLMSGQLADRPSGLGMSILSAAARGIEGFAQSAALELQPIRFNVVAPGCIATPLFENDFPNGKEVLNTMALKLPVQRVGTAEDVASAIMLLINTSFMNGAILHIDGAGRLM